MPDDDDKIFWTSVLDAWWRPGVATCLLLVMVILNMHQCAHNRMEESLDVIEHKVLHERS